MRGPSRSKSISRASTVYGAIPCGCSVSKIRRCGNELRNTLKTGVELSFSKDTETAFSVRKEMAAYIEQFSVHSTDPPNSVPIQGPELHKCATRQQKEGSSCWREEPSRSRICPCLFVRARVGP